MFQAQNRETVNSIWKLLRRSRSYDDERDKTVFHNTTPNLQDQDQDQDWLFWSQTGLVLRPTVSDHITDQGCVKIQKEDAFYCHAVIAVFAVAEKSVSNVFGIKFPLAM